MRNRATRQQSLVVACLALAWLALGLVEGPMWTMAIDTILNYP